jgi:hypothetical protein
MPQAQRVNAPYPLQPIDDPKARGVILGAIAAGSSVEIAASIAVASGFRVSAEMVTERQQQEPAFRLECETAAARSDSLVAMSLYRKATTGPDGGDTTAMIFWLKNRQPHLWRDRKELEIAIGDVPGALRSAAERARERLKLMREALLCEVVADEGETGKAIVPFIAPSNGGGNGHG